MKRLRGVVPENAGIRVIGRTGRLAGDVCWSDGETDTDATFGSSVTRVIVVEIK